MISLNWLGGEHEFALRLGELRALQENCNAGPEQILGRLSGSDWRVDDIIEPIRLGLIGAGMEAREAGPMLMQLIDQYGPIRFKALAHTIVADALIGPEDDVPGKDEGAETPPENGSSAASTETAA